MKQTYSFQEKDKYKGTSLLLMNWKERTQVFPTKIKI